MASLAYEPSGTSEHRGVKDQSKGMFTESTHVEATILLATVDSDIRAGMSALLDGYNVKSVCVKGLEELRLALARETISACFCGFWLVDGTYRDVVRQLKRQPIEIPVIVVCAPGCSQEYRDYLAALNIQAFDYICHPYRKADMERILHSAVLTQHASVRSLDPYSTALEAGSGKLRAV